MTIGLTIREVIDAPIGDGNFFVEAGTKYNLDDNVDDSFLQEFTNVDDVDATEPMSIGKFNSKLLTDKEFYVDVVVFLVEQFQRSCAEKQLIVQQNNLLGRSKAFRVIWYDDYYNEDWVNYIVYLNDILTCFDIDIKED